MAEVKVITLKQSFEPVTLEVTLTTEGELAALLDPDHYDDLVYNHQEEIDNILEAIQQTLSTRS